VRDGVLGLTLVRSPNWAFMHTNKEEEGRYYKVQDLGYHEFAYYLYFHEGDWRRAHIPRLAEELNNPPFAITEYCHGGRLGKSGSFIRCAEPNVTVSALKPAFEGLDGKWIVRVYEMEGRRTQAEVVWNAAGLRWPVDIRPFEIKTFAVDIASANIAEVDLLEEP
jgi:alpha-mannosidase